MDKRDTMKLWLRVKYDKLANAEKTPRKILKWAFRLLLIGFIMFTVFVGGTILLIFPSLPDINNIQNLVAAQSSAIYDRNGELLYMIHGEENREVVSLEVISQHAIDAVLSIEDDRFYDHSGVDFGAVLMAACSEFKICSQPRGGSTITQQFIKNAYLSSERTYTRKLKEILMAFELERKFTKEQILEMYLNRIPYGSSVYGIERAANTFFGKSAKDITLTEGAILAAIPKAPTFFSPYGDHKYPIINLGEEDILKMGVKSEQELVYRNINFITKGLIGKTHYFGDCDVPDNENADSISSETATSNNNGKCVPIYVKGRTDFVLGRMRELGYITNDEYNSAVAEAENMEFKPYIAEIKAPHFVMYVKEMLEQKYGKDQVEKGGLKITTTLDLSLQSVAEDVMKKYTDTLKDRYGASNASFVATDPDTGQILTMVGSLSYWNDAIDGKVNVAIRPRLPGSSFKPIVYAAAFLQGYAPSTVLYDVDTKFGATYQPKNYDGTFNGPVTMRGALARSLNVPAVKAGYLAGITNVLDLARKMGIRLDQKDDWYGLSLALGAGEARLLDMVMAYSIFSTGGYKMDPISILKIEDRNGNILEEYTLPKNKNLILDPQVAYLINNVLSDSDARPEGYWRNTLSVPGQIAASKTGTSNKQKDDIDYPVDCWMIGYTKNLSAGAWVGNNDGSLLKRGANGLETAGRIWNEFMAEATKGHPRTDFDKPEGIKYVKVSEKTGKLPSEHTPQDEIKTGIFASFSVPREYDTSYRLIKIDKVSGKLATEYTPEASIEEKAFFEHRSEFPDNPQWEEPVRAWAKGNNEDELAPTEYDDVHTEATMQIKPSIVITSPANYATVSAPYVGVWVDVEAKGGVNYVEYYWDDILTETVKTSPYKGAIKISKSDKIGSTHTIKVIVYDSLYRSSQSSIQVKIGKDDIPPVASFVYPADGAKLYAGSSMAAFVDANDPNGDIEKVEFYMNGTLKQTVKHPPYVWQFITPQELGSHTIETVAYDYSGNTAKDLIEIVSIELASASASANSRITEPYKNQSFNEGARILIQATIGEEDRNNLKELIVSARQIGGRTSEIAKALGDPNTGGAHMYTFVWDAPSAGTYELFLKIVLQDGKIRFSERTSVVVR